MQNNTLLLDSPATQSSSFVLDDAALLSATSAGSADMLTPTEHGPKMLFSEAIALGLEDDAVSADKPMVCFSASERFSDEGALLTPVQILTNRVLAERPALNEAVQKGSQFVESASDAVAQATALTKSFTQKTQQEIAEEARGWLKVAEETWSAPDNTTRIALKQRTDQLADGVGELIQEIDDSDRMEKVRGYWNKAAKAFNNFTDSLYSELGYVETTSTDAGAIALEQAELRLQANLLDLREDASFEATVQTAFGDGVDTQSAKSLIDKFVTGEAAPQIKVVAADILKGDAAFGDNTIFVSAAYLQKNAANPEAIDAVLLEEAGHYFDQALNTADAAGDEGNIFARLALGETLSAEVLQRLKAEDDRSTITHNGKVIEVENFWDSVSSGFDSFTSSVSDSFSSAVDTVSDYTSSTYDTVSDYASNTYDTVSDYTSSTYDSVSDYTSSTYDSVSDYASNTYDSVSDYASNTYDSVSDYTSSTYDTVSDYASNTYDSVSDYTSSTYDSVSDYASDTYDTVSDYASDTYSSAVDFTADAYDSASNTLSNGWDSFSNTAANTWDTVTDTYDSTVETVSDTYDTVTDTVAETWVETKETATEFVDDVAETATDLKDTVVEFADEAGEAIAQTATNAKDATVEFVTEDIPQFVTEDIPEWVAENESTVNRVVGGVQVVGGVAEMATGAALVPTGAVSFGAGTVAGGVVMAHGADTTFAGLKALWTGESQQTFTEQGITAVADVIPGVSTENAETAGLVGDIAVGILAPSSLVTRAITNSADNIAAGAADNVVAGIADNVAAGAADNVAAGIADNVAAGATDNVAAGITDNVAAAATDDVAAGAEEGVTTFFHGTTAEVAENIRVEGIDLSKGSSASDFGQGFYMTTSPDEALQSASRLTDGTEPLDVVRFDVPNSELDSLTGLNLPDAASTDWQDFVEFHKTYEPSNLLHGGDPYDMVSGPLFRRYSGPDEVPIAWSDRVPQTSIHTPNAVEVFNRHAVPK